MYSRLGNPAAHRPLPDHHVLRLLEEQEAQRALRFRGVLQEEPLQRQVHHLRRHRGGHPLREGLQVQTRAHRVPQNPARVGARRLLRVARQPRLQRREALRHQRRPAGLPQGAIGQIGGPSRGFAAPRDPDSQPDQLRVTGLH